jgi:hypothetical protein
MQTSTDNVGIFINLVHDYNTRDKLQQKYFSRSVLAATNDAT